MAAFSFEPFSIIVLLFTASLFSLIIYSHLHGKPYASTVPSPKTTLIPNLTREDIEKLPYHPDFLPGGRQVQTPYGSIQVFEWGPKTGERILFVHGMSLPCISLGNLAEEFARRKYRVMLFDLFGRGYSDAPQDVVYDAKLFITQILFVLNSSPLNWMDSVRFHLVGYSFGGCLCVSFARYFHRHLRSLTLITPGGLLRPHHLNWQGKLLYKSKLIPRVILRPLVERRIQIPDEPSSVIKGNATSQDSTRVTGKGDGTGGASFDYASISRRHPHITVSSVMAWEIKHHRGFIDAFTQSMGDAPMYQPQPDWCALGSILAENAKNGGKLQEAGTSLTRVLVILCENDPIVVKEEVSVDIKAALGDNGVQFIVLQGGHETPITKGNEVARDICEFWGR